MGNRYTIKGFDQYTIKGFEFFDENTHMKALE